MAQQQEALISAGLGTTNILNRPALAILQIGDSKTTTDYVVTTDYTIVNGAIAWVVGKGPVLNATFYVTYTYALVVEQIQPAYIEVQRVLDDGGVYSHGGFIVKDQQAETFNVPAVVGFTPSAPSNFGIEFKGINEISAPDCDIR